MKGKIHICHVLYAATPRFPQASPSSQQAVQATCLLRHANDAVEEARAAVTRGDAAWLARVAETLAAVQAAVDALHDFK